MQLQKRKKIIAVFLTIYLISVGSSWGYFFYLQDADYDKRVIQQFSPSDSKFSEIYEVENRRLVNVARESYIFPNDRLEYRFTINNPLEHNIRVTYEFEVFRAGEREHSDIGEFYFQGNDVEHRQFEFFLKDEGPYDLKANWIFYNTTDNKKYAQFAPLERDIQVLSLANKLQDDANQLTYKGLIAVSVVGIGTIAALIMNVIFSKLEVDKLDTQNQYSGNQIKLLKNQNKDLKEQTSIQNRPWVSLISENPVTLQGNHFQIQFKNYGKSVATDITTISMIKKGKITTDELIEKVPSSPFDLSPQEKFSHWLLIPKDILDVIGTSDIYFGIILQYKFEETKEGESLLIARWGKELQRESFEIKKLK